MQHALSAGDALMKENLDLLVVLKNKLAVAPERPSACAATQEASLRQVVHVEPVKGGAIEVPVDAPAAALPLKEPAPRHRLDAQGGNSHPLKHIVVPKHELPLAVHLSLHL